MIQIRKGVFETNSSSTHSITISLDNSELMDTIKLDTDNNITLKGGEFGWGWKKYNDALTKANYCVQDGFDRELLSEVIKEQTGAENVFFSEIDIDEGYIDHQSTNTTFKIKNKEELRQFIFNPKSWLYIGNNNNYAPFNFFDNPDVIYTHKIFIERFKTTAFFKEEPTKSEIIKAIEISLEYARYNETKNLYEVDPCYSSSDEIYYKYSTYCGSKINFKNNTITLIKDIYCYYIEDRDKAIKMEKKLRKLPKNQKTIKFYISTL